MASKMRIAMIPSLPPMVPLPLMVKSSSIDKLNEFIMAEDCQDLPLTLFGRFYQSTKYWLAINTEQHRKRLSAEVKKNWLRFLVSITVVFIQFIWFASYYIGMNSMESNLTIEQVVHHPTPTNNNVAKNSPPMSVMSGQAPSPPSKTSSSLPSINSVIININSTASNKETSKSKPALSMIPSCQMFGIKSNLQMVIQNHNHQRHGPAQKDPWPSFMWRMVLGIKLALMMIGLELVRLFDTVWEVFRKPKSCDEDKNRKSFIDLSYIERNRGYK